MTETTPTRQPGRPPKDNSKQVGRRYVKLVIQAILPAKDSHGRRALAVCDCGGVIETRLSRLKSGETTSCGCVKITRFMEFIGRAVDRLPEGMVSAIWEDHFAGQSRTDIAETRDVKVSVVDEAIRRYQRQLDTMLANGTAGQVYFTAGEKGGLKAAAAAHSLPLTSSRYLVMAVSRKPAAARPYVMTDTDYQAMACEFHRDRVADREQNYNLGIPQTGEFTFKEIRRSKGKILGMLAPDYITACTLLSSRLEPHQVNRLTPFVNLVNDTFASRQRRQKAGAIRIVKQHRKDAAFDRHRLELSRQLNFEPYQESLAA